MYRNSKGYRLGDEFRYDGYIMYQLTSEVALEMQLQGMIQGKRDGEAEEVVAGRGHLTNDASKGYMSPVWDPEQSGKHRICRRGNRSLRHHYRGDRLRYDYCRQRGDRQYPHR